MRKRLMLAAGIFAVFVLLIVATSSIGGTDQKTPRHTADSFAKAFVKGDAKTIYSLFTPGEALDNPLKSDGSSELQVYIAKEGTLFKGNAPLFSRTYVSDTYPTSGFTIAEYDLTDTSNNKYTLSVVLLQQPATSGSVWDVADYSITQKDTN